MPRKLWLTWETQRRNPELASAFGYELLVVDLSHLASWKRYLLSARNTLSALREKKPESVVAQCPSLALVTLLAIFKPIFRFRFIVDAHNAFFDYSQSSNPALALATKFVARSSDYIIVSNRALKKPVEQLQGRPIVLPDKLPAISRSAVRPAILDSAQGKIITCICSFAADEPLEELLTACAKYEGGATFFITGKKARAGALLRFESEKLRFTDYLPEAEYIALLSHSDLIIDTSTRENCLLCGAYESLALEVPSLLSNSEALRETFKGGAWFSENSEASFLATLSRALQGDTAGGMNIRLAKSEFEATWENYFSEAFPALTSGPSDTH